MIKKVIYKNMHEHLISAYLHSPEKDTEKVVILCHGMESSKDGTKVTHLANKFCETGYNAIRFDFRYAGESEGYFEDITLTGEVEDLKATYDYCKRKNMNEIYIVGSSLGATVSLIFSSSNQIKKLVLIAPPILFKNEIKRWFGKKNLKIFKKDSFYINEENVKIKWDFVKDAYSYNFKKIIKKIDCPVLLIHGEKDNVVLINNSKFINDNLKTDKRFLKIKDGAHKLNDKFNDFVPEIIKFINV